MNARQRRRAHYLRSLSAPAGHDAAVAQAVDQHLADLDDGHRLRWDAGVWIWEQAVGDQWAEIRRYPDLASFARAQALDIPATPAGRR